MTRHSGTLLSKYYKRLADYDLFKDIAPSNLEAVLNCVKARITTYPKNAFLVLEKDDISIAGLILEGNVAMLKEDDQGHQSMITYMREGELFGEVFSLARDHTSIVSYRTMTRCTVMYLSVSKVLNTCQNDCRFHRQLIINLFDCMAKKNTRLMSKIDAISRNTIRDRILVYLRSELESFNQIKGTPDNRQIHIPINKTELAQFLCVHRSSLVKELSLMKKEGLIEEEGHVFTLNGDIS